MKDNKKLIDKIMLQTLNENTSYTQDYIEGMEAGIKAAIQAQAAEVERLRGGLVRISLLKYQDSCDLLDCVKIAESTLTTNKGE